MKYEVQSKKVEGGSSWIPMYKTDDYLDAVDQVSRFLLLDGGEEEVGEFAYRIVREGRV